MPFSNPITYLNSATSSDIHLGWIQNLFAFNVLEVQMRTQLSIIRCLIKVNNLINCKGRHLFRKNRMAMLRVYIFLIITKKSVKGLTINEKCNHIFNDSCFFNSNWISSNCNFSKKTAKYWLLFIFLTDFLRKTQYLCKMQKLLWTSTLK